MIAYATSLALISFGTPQNHIYTSEPVSGTVPQRADSQQAAPDAGPPDAGPPKPQLTSEQIIKTLQTHRPKIQKCYETESRKKPGIAGKVDVSFVIQTNGALTGAALKSSTLNDDAVHKCILAELATITFDPTPQSPVALGYGWNFETSNTPPAK
jgi:hypothetical protein